jgi:pilus assembly protein CpaF
MSLDLILPFLRPIERLLLDPGISEIMGNPDGSWWFERDGRIAPATGVRFERRTLETALEVIANQFGRKLDRAHPLLHVQLPDGSRLAAVLPPIVRPNPSVTIRKFAEVRYTVSDLVVRGTLSSELAAYLRVQVEAGRTMLISGGTGSGKTTLLNALAEFIPDRERLIVIEDTAELRIDKPNLLAAECQTESHGGTVGFDHLLKASLRWRPDRIIVGEVRGDEARTLLDSFNTGHAGSMATIHASSAVKALRRFGELAMRSHQQATREDISSEIADSVHLVIQIQRVPEGRRITQVIELRGYDRVQKSFLFETQFDVTHPCEANLAPLLTMHHQTTGEHHHAIA